MFTIEESAQFLRDVEEAAGWILLSNIEHSESLAAAKVQEFIDDIHDLKARLEKLPESGEVGLIQGLRKSPVCNGRYSASWIVDHVR